ncbi:hypothetical protein MMP64_12295 [Acinetobacter sp. ANC 5659]|uniref:hypothetical protein n=1 Tax=Acinetobacter higginsii TaxID=70347 RepID=UPI001F4B0FE2|nr:hypothetical protein [Acinetobacter higginsii]MCH7318708.1 hypothetical protein [Acinetobacter higginsii]
MNNILNAQDAFAALQKGKNLLCRFKESDFMELDQFPATVFGLPDYEFCLDIEKIELSGFKFTKPYELDELVDEQDIFVIDFTCSHVLQGKYNSKNKHLIGMVENGLVQRSIFDAESQIRAFHNVIGVHNGVIVRCEDFTGKPLKADSSSEPKQTRKRESTKDAVDPQIGHYFDQVKRETAEWNVQLQNLLTRLQSTKTPGEANALVSDTKTWTEDQRQPLLRAISRRLQEFQNPKPTEQPSLAVQIQNAPDLTTLDALEIDVSSLDVVIQPEMLRLITTRRLQLEKAANDESQAS